MKKIIHFTLTLAMISFLFGALQAKSFDVLTLKVSNKDGSTFPLVTSKEYPEVAKKVNTYLQVEILEKSPNEVKNNSQEALDNGITNTIDSLASCDINNYYIGKRYLSINMAMEGCGAYCEGYTQYYNFDTLTGALIHSNQLFTAEGKKSLEDKIRKNSLEKILNFIEKSKKFIKNNPNGYTKEKDYYDEQLSMYEECYTDRQDKIYFKLDKDSNFILEEESISFLHDRCSNHALMALDDLSDFKNTFSTEVISPYLSEYGKKILNKRSIKNSRIIHNFELVSKQDNILNLKLNGKKEFCEISILLFDDKKSKVMVNPKNCKTFTNSKHINIICTKKKSICKTQKEVLDLLDILREANAFDYDRIEDFLDYYKCQDNSRTLFDDVICSTMEIKDLEISMFYNGVITGNNLATEKLLNESYEALVLYTEHNMDLDTEFDSTGPKGMPRLFDMNCRFRYIAKNYKLMVEKVKNGLIPKVSLNLYTLNKKIISMNKQTLLDYKNDSHDSKSEKKDTQELYAAWITYRDHTAKLFAQISSKKSELFWKIWLSEQYPNGFVEYVEFRC